MMPTILNIIRLSSVEQQRWNKRRNGVRKDSQYLTGAGDPVVDSNVRCYHELARIVMKNIHLKLILYTNKQSMEKVYQKRP
jgi:hypothetical protein